MLIKFKFKKSSIVNKGYKLSKNKAFSDTTISRYSLALYELAEENNSTREIENHSNCIVDLISKSDDFNSLIKDPTNKKEEQLKAIIKIFEFYKFDDLLKKFISFLILKRRFFYVEKILKNFIETCSKKRGEIKAELTSSKKLTDIEINNIKEELNKNFGSKIILNYNYDPSLIGGLVMQVGSTMIDTSIKNKLQQIENKMVEA